MAQTYTMDEAAVRLGISPEELKRRIREDWKTIRSFRDGATLRFRASDIDDLARSLGQASDPGVQPKAKTASPADDFLVPPGDSESSEELNFKSSEFAMGTKGKKTGDSDIRLDGSSGPKPDAGENQPTEEISLDVSGPGSKPKSGKMTAAKSGTTPTSNKSSKIPGPSDVIATTDSSSEFELSLDSDSDSFELDLNTGSGDKPPLAAKSGITLDKPADGGVSLSDDSDESLDFDLSLDAEPADKKKKKPVLSHDSDSEFELALDDNSGITDGLAAEIQGEENKGDIFETDFDMPAAGDSDSESGSEVVAVDSDLSENSDFDLALDESDVQIEDDESASQVVLIDDEEEAPAPSRSGKKGLAAVGAGAAAAAGAAVLLDDSDDGQSASRALRGVHQDDDDGPVRIIQAASPKWGALPTIMGSLTLLFAFLGTIMSFELLRGMTGYNAPGKGTGPVVKLVASTLGMTPSEKN